MHGWSQNLAEEDDLRKTGIGSKYAGPLRPHRSDCIYPTNIRKKVTLHISILNNIYGHVENVSNGRKIKGKKSTLRLLWI